MRGGFISFMAWLWLGFAIAALVFAFKSEAFYASIIIASIWSAAAALRRSAE